MSCKAGYGAPKRASIDQNNKTLFDDPSISCGSQYQTIRDGTKKPIAKCQGSGVVEIVNDCEICLSCSDSSPAASGSDPDNKRTYSERTTGECTDHDRCGARDFKFADFGPAPQFGGKEFTKCMYSAGENNDATANGCGGANQAHYFGTELYRKCIDGTVYSKWTQFFGTCSDRGYKDAYRTFHTDPYIKDKCTNPATNCYIGPSD